MSKFTVVIVNSMEMVKKTANKVISIRGTFYPSFDLDMRYFIKVDFQKTSGKAENIFRFTTTH